MCLLMYSSHLAVSNLVQAVLVFIKSPNTESSVGIGASQRTAKTNPPKRGVVVQAILSGSLHCAWLTHGPWLRVLSRLMFPQGFKANASHQLHGLTVRGTLARGAAARATEWLNTAPTFG